MFAVTPVLRRSLKDYRAYEGEELIENVTKMAKSLRGSRVLHLSPVPQHSRLFDTSDTLTSLLQSVGIAAEWRIIRTKPNQMMANKTLNLALDGHFVQWTPDLHDSWLHRDADLADISLQDYDFIVVHGVELASITAHSFHPSSTVPPTVDPLSLRNKDIPQRFVDAVLRQHGLDPQHPFVLHILPESQDFGAISRLIDGFRLAKERVSELQMLTLITGDGDDQRSLAYSNYLNYRLGRSDQTHVVHVESGVGNIEINVFQRAASAVLEESIDDEYGAALLLEAMWKERPVIVGTESAALLGIQDGQSGYEARSAEDYGSKIVSLLESPLRATAIGRGAKEHVQQKFLVTKLLHTYLATLCRLASEDAVEIANTARVN